MTDRELLELAAKAAGMNVFAGEWTEGQDGWFFCMQHGFPGMHFAPNDNRAHSVGPWRPLADDGDALRLAVKLSIHIEFSKKPHNPSADRVQASPMGMGHLAWVELHENDPYAATRRAIVRAAAELGKAMP